MTIDTDYELQAQREATQDLIDSRPTLIVLHRPPAPADDGVGGRLREGAPTELEGKVRFFGGVALSIRSGIITHSGGHDQFSALAESRWIMVGTWDDDIQVGDTFVLEGKDYLVERIADDRSYEIRATCLLVEPGG